MERTERKEKLFQHAIRTSNNFRNSKIGGLLYPLIGSTSFRDITAGGNGAFQAGPGYDMVTGIGVPNVKQLIAVLAV